MAGREDPANGGNLRSSHERKGFVEQEQDKVRDYPKIMEIHKNELASGAGKDQRLAGSRYKVGWSNF
jgi:hypothetical protein